MDSSSSIAWYDTICTSVHTAAWSGKAGRNKRSIIILLDVGVFFFFAVVPGSVSSVFFFFFWSSFYHRKNVLYVRAAVNTVCVRGGGYTSGVTASSCSPCHCCCCCCVQTHSCVGRLIGWTNEASWFPAAVVVVCFRKWSPWFDLIWFHSIWLIGWWTIVIPKHRDPHADSSLFLMFLMLLLLLWRMEKVSWANLLVDGTVGVQGWGGGEGGREGRLSCDKTLTICLILVSCLK